MNIAKKSNLTKKKVITLVILVIFLVSGLVLLEKLHVIDVINSAPESTSGPTEAEKAEQKKLEQKQKQDLIESPEQTSGSGAPDDQLSSMELSAKQESNGSVTILTKLYDVSGGTCSLTIMNGSNSYTKDVDIIYQPTFSSCAGFSVEKNELGPGTWVVRLRTLGESQLEKTIELKVN